MQLALECHVTYKCNLSCAHCNRGVGLCIDHTPDLTLDQWRHCLEGVPPLVALKRKVLSAQFTGGEPTLRDDIPDFVEATLAAVPRSGVAIFSNAATPRSRRILEDLGARYGMRNLGAPKVKGEPDYEFDTTMFLDPADTGLVRHEPCGWGHTCGSSVDAYGMTPCPMGGMIDGVLKLGVRTWDWSALTLERLMRLCAHCGRGLGEPSRSVEIFTVRGYRMTKAWKDAVEGWTP
jgi:hypothetical protein